MSSKKNKCKYNYNYNYKSISRENKRKQDKKPKKTLKEALPPNAPRSCQIQQTGNGQGCFVLISDK
jgi:hypothetical protein